jgi:hypothetical protein
LRPLTLPLPLRRALRCVQHLPKFYLRAQKAKPVRTIAEIPHPLMRITVTSWNEKYQLRFEIDRYEQMFKVGHDEVESVDALRARALTMSESVLMRFVDMRSQWQALQPPSQP